MRVEIGADSAVEATNEHESRGWPWRVAFAIGAGGLTGAALSDSIAVLGRHVGFGFLGSIEISQAFVCLIASGSILVATLSAGHAAVHMVTDRLGERQKRRLALVSDLFFMATFAVVIAGGFWVLFDMWGGAEQSELLGIPIIPFRLLWLSALTGVLVSVLVSFIKALRHV
ncbi:MAG TPA: TRAP transporter small permease subunit [Allosphingosinicella sp.]|jgi:TRAP-type C4-dicarboxylate transport system permease small subunit